MGQTHEGCDFPFESEALNQGHVENENMAYFNTRSVVSIRFVGTDFGACRPAKARRSGGQEYVKAVETCV
jgi:hypothetical protein